MEHALHVAEGIPTVSSIYLNVWEPNKRAIQFYEKLGFKITETLDNYYPDLTPKSAYTLSLNVNHEKKEKK